MCWEYLPCHASFWFQSHLSAFLFCCHTRTLHKEPRDEVVAKECHMSSYDGLFLVSLFFFVLLSQLHTFFLLLFWIPFDSPLKFHSVIPPGGKTIVTPISVNNMAGGGIPTKLQDDDRRQKDVRLRVKYLGPLAPGFKLLRMKGCPEWYMVTPPHPPIHFFFFSGSIRSDLCLLPSLHNEKVMLKADWELMMNVIGYS